MFEPRYLRHHITNIEADDASSDEFQVRANVGAALKPEMTAARSSARSSDEQMP